MMTLYLVKVIQNRFCTLILFMLLSVLFVEVMCRQAVQPVEDVEEIVRRLNDINLDVTDNEGSSCLLNIQQDLPKGNTLQPLYIIPDTNEFWLPNARGQLQVPQGSTIELYCSKSFTNATKDNNGTSSNNNNNSTNKFNNVLKLAKNTKALRLRCLHSKTFLWQGEKYELKQFICEQPPKYTVEQLHEKCPDSMTDGQVSVTAQMYRVGFNITDNRFLETMRICYDDTILRTLYVQHTLFPASIHFQKFIKRINFSKAGHFKAVNINCFYTQQSQRQRAAVLLQGHQQHHLFNNSTLFLARGHLAAKSDFIYGNQQRTTFNFFNAAPQWQTFNGGMWATLEHEVRKFVARSKLLVDCYTGTFGTLKLPYKAQDGIDDGNGTASVQTIENRDFYLAKDDNNNGLLPVPQLFYRVLIDRSHHPLRGIALIGVNNPHAALSEIIASYIVCDDIHNQVNWLQWMVNKNLKKGFMYACRVSDFVAVVRHLPKSLLNATAILS